LRHATCLVEEEDGEEEEEEEEAFKQKDVVDALSRVESCF